MNLYYSNSRQRTVNRIAVNELLIDDLVKKTKRMGLMVNEDKRIRALPPSIKNTNVSASKFNPESLMLIKLYKSLIIPVLMYGEEVWTRQNSMRRHEIKVLHKIYGPQNIGYGEYRRRWNDELYELYDDIDIVQRIKRQRLRGLGHVVRIDESAPTLKVFDAEPTGEVELLTA